MLDLMTPRVLAGAASRRARLGLDAVALERARQAAVDALAGGRRRSRAELFSVWEGVGLSTAGQRGYHMLWHLAQTGLVCFGPVGDGEQLLVLLDEWILHPRRPERDEALGELARRYFASHGPATLKDFMRWTNLVAADARVGLALSHVRVHGIRASSPFARRFAPVGRRSTVRTMHEHEHGGQRSGGAAQAAEWDARYGERDGAMWSGRPNGRLVAEVADLIPGRALDVGCGEGADAIWLAGHSWTVTAIDISDVAVCRAREAAELAGARVEWVCGDALQSPFRPCAFDLVSMQYPALPKAAGDAAARTLLDTLRPGGLLLAVYHDLDDEHREHMKSRGIDPEDYIGADDLDRLLGDDFAVEPHAVEPRIDPPPGTPHIADVVLRARRR